MSVPSTFGASSRFKTPKAPFGYFNGEVPSPPDVGKKRGSPPFSVGIMSGPNGGVAPTDTSTVGGRRTWTVLLQSGRSLYRFPSTVVCSLCCRGGLCRSWDASPPSSGVKEP